MPTAANRAQLDHIGLPCPVKQISRRCAQGSSDRPSCHAVALATALLVALLPTPASLPAAELRLLHDTAAATSAAAPANVLLVRIGQLAPALDPRGATLLPVNS
eukprot:7473575-Heterocapsa_arctica.AAC.1